MRQPGHRIVNKITPKFQRGTFNTLHAPDNVIQVKNIVQTFGLEKVFVEMLFYVVD